MSRDARTTVGHRLRRTVIGEAGVPGVLSVLGILALVVVVAAAFAAIQPPTVDALEEDIWRDWARLATDAQGRTFVDLLLDDQRAAGQQMLESFGKLIDSQGEQFVVRTFVEHLLICDHTGKPFAEWRSPSSAAAHASWRRLHITLEDPTEGAVGTLDVTYQFYGGGLDALPNIRRLQGLYTASLWLVGVLAVLILTAVVANIARIRERAARLQSQQITIDLAHQMCHELRNGLWSFSLEGKNLRQLFAVVDKYFRVVDAELRPSAAAAGISPEQLNRLQLRLERTLAEHEVHPQTDVLAVNAMAADAHQQVERFSRYINLTVEELDRNLLGSGGQWEPTLMRLGDAWKEACELLSMRINSAGVVHRIGTIVADDLIVGDWRSLVHVFVNLAKNAIEAMRGTSGPRELGFDLGADATSVWCVVSNTGAAIPGDLLPRLFEGGVSTKPGAGRGTGLLLVRESVERMNGRIHVERSDGRGTAFRLTFPKPSVSDRAVWAPQTPPITPTQNDTDSRTSTAANAATELDVPPDR